MPGKLIALVVSALLVLAPVASSAADTFRLVVRGGGGDLRDAVETASLLSASRGDATADPRDVLAAARADYARILNALYSQGYYGGIVRILVDGREAAEMPAFSAPTRIGSIRIEVVPGRRFRFATAEITPLAPGTTLLPQFSRGEVASSTVIRDAVAAAIAGWRDAGRAKVQVAGQRVVADHRDQTLDAQVTLAPGPVVTFGRLLQSTRSAVRAGRIARIAGLPTGETFSPQALDEATGRLRRTGAFSSVTMSEAEALGPAGTLDIELSVADQKPRRFGFGVGLSSLDGLSATAFWIDRNLLGGAERLRFDAELSDITGALPGMDAAVTARIDVPAALGTDTGAFVTAEAEYRDDPAYRLRQTGIGLGLQRRFSSRLEGEAAVAFRYSTANDDLGSRQFSVLSVPASATWDGRDSLLDPTSGIYLRADFEPFTVTSGGVSGARARLEGRSYIATAEDRLVFAGRAQLGSVIGAGVTQVPPDFLFFSGGDGRVRGFPYQSLGAGVGGNTIGGSAFLGVSAELRFRASETIGAVAFSDAGHVGANGLFGSGSDWQVGAGIGLRYYTGIGPIRLDLAAPVSGPGGRGAQIYIGIGQAF